jgi:hypothetical protein
MRLFIHYDEKGRILSADKANVFHDSLADPGGVAGSEKILEVEPTDELTALDCHEICEKYTVDTKKMVLKKKR